MGEKIKETVLLNYSINQLFADTYLLCAVWIPAFQKGYHRTGVQRRATRVMSYGRIFFKYRGISLGKTLGGRTDG